MFANKVNTIAVLLVVLALLGHTVSISGQTGIARAKRGFGCKGPIGSDRYECDRHCKDNKFRGGYCDMGGFRCNCYG
ncbi:unnamed protein product [Oppiella nova]|uniref:Invertebrate defensins family profile domain-containing protein n=1 Tax=Oppiella nova TaxID=334625 RepID=A0A7R9M1E5_9ACAR|nr:unnamed protein product [Oppiella nova]CAG2168925.1 unnamed protein product [Oppiella nova]